MQSLPPQAEKVNPPVNFSSPPPTENYNTPPQISQLPHCRQWRIFPYRNELFEGDRDEGFLTKIFFHPHKFFPTETNFSRVGGSAGGFFTRNFFNPHTFFPAETNFWRGGEGIVTKDFLTKKFTQKIAQHRPTLFYLVLPDFELYLASTWQTG